MLPSTATGRPRMSWDQAPRLPWTALGNPRTHRSRALTFLSTRPGNPRTHRSRASDVPFDEAVGSTDGPAQSNDAPGGETGGALDATDEGGLSGSGCRFRDTSGVAVITKVVYSSDPRSACNAMVTFYFIAGLTLDGGSGPFALDGGTTVDAGAPPSGGRMSINPVEEPPCSYLESNGIVLGAMLPAIRQDAFAGACPTPVYVFPGIENSQYMGP